MTSTAVDFSEDYSEVVLLDVSDEAIRRAVESPGAKVYFKGSHDAVLCTQAATFELFSRETSNELLLLSGNHIVGWGGGRVIEPCKIPPRLDQLKTVLLERALTLDDITGGSEDDEDEEDEEEAGRKRKRIRRHDPDMEELILTVQASEEEIQRGLQALGAFQTEKGGWRMLSRSLEERILEQFVLALKAELVDVEKDRVEEDQVVEWLPEFPAPAVRAMYSKFMNDSQLVIDRLAVFVNEVILSTRNAIEFAELEECLKERLPSLSAGRIDISKVLKGIGLVSEDNKTVSYFPVANLPRDPKKRCEELFEVRSFWLPHDFEAFLDGVDGGCNSAIQKYTRTFTNPKGERGYIKR